MYQRTSSVPRQQQQQPQRHTDRQQQQMSGSGEFQPIRRSASEGTVQMGDRPARASAQVSSQTALAGRR
ncbi:MAG: hypothetical protein Q7T87_08290 [Polaromonas sp.]|nr:hypothetical protein [Polaromonas sp.]